MPSLKHTLPVPIPIPVQPPVPTPPPTPTPATPAFSLVVARRDQLQVTANHGSNPSITRGLDNPAVYWADMTSAAADIPYAARRYVRRSDNGLGGAMKNFLVMQFGSNRDLRVEVMTALPTAALHVPTVGIATVIGRPGCAYVGASYPALVTPISPPDGSAPKYNLVTINGLPQNFYGC